MSEVNLKCRLKIKQDSKANWQANNPVLLDGELGLYKENNSLCIVSGDGVNPFNKLKVYYVPNNEIMAGRNIDIVDGTISISQNCIYMGDLNDAVFTGYYKGWNMKNSPAENCWFFGFVLASDINNVRQVFWKFAGNNVVSGDLNDRYERVKCNGEWGEWTNTSVRKAVPKDAIFTDTTYVAGRGIGIEQNEFKQNVIKLSDACKAISDWNEADKSGFYIGYGAENSPIKDGFFYGIVIAQSTKTVRQIIWQFAIYGQTNTTNVKYEREKDNGTWNEWIITNEFGYKTKKEISIVNNKTITVSSNTFTWRTENDKTFMCTSNNPFSDVWNPTDAPDICGFIFKVIWDGTEYILLGHERDRSYAQGIDEQYLFGNTSLLGYSNSSDDDTIPFLIVVGRWGNTNTDQKSLKILTSDASSTSHTISISRIEMDYKKIPPYYLDTLHRSSKLIHKGSAQSGIVIGLATDASGEGSVAEGECTIASGYASHAESYATTASGQASHAEGEEATASGMASHAEGVGTTASGEVSHAEGIRSTASGIASHAEGRFGTASGERSHAECDNSTASGFASHAEGSGSIASQNSSHAEGYRTQANAKVSHAEGYQTKTTDGMASHAEGAFSEAKGQSSHVEGLYTKASSKNQHVQGRYNIEDTENKYAHIVGNGTSEEARSNAHTLDWEGNAMYAGDVEAQKQVKGESVNINNKIDLLYNSSTESLDFVFK